MRVASRVGLNDAMARLRYAPAGSDAERYLRIAMRVVTKERTFQSRRSNVLINNNKKSSFCFLAASKKRPEIFRVTNSRDMSRFVSV